MFNHEALKNQLFNSLQGNQVPTVQNALDLYRQGKSNEVVQIAQNACQQMGVSYDQMKQKAMAQFGINI